MVNSIVIPLFEFNTNFKELLNVFVDKNLNEDIEIIFLNFILNTNYIKELSEYTNKYDKMKLFNEKDIDNNKARRYILKQSKKNHVFFIDSLNSTKINKLNKFGEENNIIDSYNSFIEQFIENNFFEKYKEILYNDKIHFVFSEYEKTPEKDKIIAYKFIKNDFTKIIENNNYIEFICILNELNREKFESIIYSNDYEEFKIKYSNAKLNYQNKHLNNKINKLKKVISN